MEQWAMQVTCNQPGGTSNLPCKAMAHSHKLFQSCWNFLLYLRLQILLILTTKHNSHSKQNNCPMVLKHCVCKKHCVWCCSPNHHHICAALKKNHEFISSCRNTSFANPKWYTRGNFNWIKFEWDILCDQTSNLASREKAILASINCILQALSGENT